MSERTLRRAPAAPRERGVVLLVEDDPQVGALLRALLEGLGYDVCERRSGREALSAAAALGETLTVLVTDLALPEMSGHELIGALRASHPQLPVLIVSGYAQEDLAAAKPGTDVLEKPFTVAQLACKLERLLGGADKTEEKEASPL
jgi:CheY-like chemotaxis protein